MNETEARNALLVRSFETAPKGDVEWSDDDRAWASRAAAEVEGASASADRFVARRAALALERLASRGVPVRRALRASEWHAWLGWAIPLFAFVVGVLTDAIGPSHHVNVLAPPLLALLSWNVVVYLSLALRPFGRAFGLRAQKTTARWIARARQRRIVRDRGSARAPVLARFAADWTRESLRLISVRVSRVLHVSSIALALGMLMGLYVRGLVFEYRAGWESTFLDANAVQAVLGFVLRPASALTGIALPDAVRLETMRFPESAGERAAPWIHLHAVTIALFVVVPRTLLALYNRALEFRLSSRFPIVWSDPWFAALAREHSGEPARVVIVPCHFAPTPQTTLELRSMLGAVFGASLQLSIEEPVEYGAEEEVETRVAAMPDAALVIGLFSSSATPESETHGVFIDRARAVLPEGAQLVALVDESAFAARFGGTDEVSIRRRDERRIAWKRLLAAHGYTPVFIDLERTDQPEAQRRLREALDRRARVSDIVPA